MARLEELRDILNSQAERHGIGYQASDDLLLRSTLMRTPEKLTGFLNDVWHKVTLYKIGGSVKFTNSETRILPQGLLDELKDGRDSYREGRPPGLDKYWFSNPDVAGKAIEIIVEEFAKSDVRFISATERNANIKRKLSIKDYNRKTEDHHWRSWNPPYHEYESVYVSTPVHNHAKIKDWYKEKFPEEYEALREKYRELVRERDGKKEQNKKKRANMAEAMDIVTDIFSPDDLRFMSKAPDFKEKLERYLEAHSIEDAKEIAKTVASRKSF